MVTLESTLTLRMVRARNAVLNLEQLYDLGEDTQSKIPWSVWTTFGSPTKAKNFNRALVKILAVIFLRGTASGKQVAVHITVNRYWYPLFDRGRGPTQSMIIFSKGSLTAGMGYNGAGGIIWFGLPLTWQTWHILQYRRTSRFSPGQKKNDEEGGWMF